MREDLGGRPLEHDRAPAGEHVAVVGELGHRVDVVRRHDHRAALLGVLADQRDQLRARCRVEALERLVEHEQLRVHDQRARQRDLALLAAGQVVRHARREVLDAQASQDRRDAAREPRARARRTAAARRRRRRARSARGSARRRSAAPRRCACGRPSTGAQGPRRRPPLSPPRCAAGRAGGRAASSSPSRWGRARRRAAPCEPRSRARTARPQCRPRSGASRS